MTADPLGFVLAAPAPIRADDAASFFATYRALTRDAVSPWEAAVRGGALADRLGHAFVAGYEAALAALVPSHDRARAAALCATEPGGAHPRAIATVLDEGLLRGEKAFVTLGDAAEDLYVLAKQGETDEGRARLVLARVGRDAPGVVVTPLPPLSFVPEIPHASVRFDGARPAEILHGDGWADYVRPFRTVEDVHVHGALLAWLGATAVRHGWPREAVARALALLGALGELARLDPSSPSTHVALAGTIELTRALVRDLEPAWQAAPEDDRIRWTRDRALLDVAAKARAARLERAWERIDERRGAGR